MRSQPAETAAVARPSAASRGEYLRRRRSTPAGRQELRRFRRTALALAAYTAAVAAAVRLDLIAVTAAEVTTAWEDLATDRLPTTAAVKAAAALAVALTAPLALSAARVAIRLRPWRPHSGTPAMWSAPPQRLQDTWPTWRAVAQAHMLADHTPTTAAAPTRRATLQQPTHSANEEQEARPGGTGPPCTAPHPTSPSQTTTAASGCPTSLSATSPRRSTTTTPTTRPSQNPNQSPNPPPPSRVIPPAVGPSKRPPTARTNAPTASRHPNRRSTHRPQPTTPTTPPNPSQNQNPSQSRSWSRSQSWSPSPSLDPGRRTPTALVPARTASTSTT